MQKDRNSPHLSLSRSAAPDVDVHLVAIAGQLEGAFDAAGAVPGLLNQVLEHVVAQHGAVQQRKLLPTGLGPAFSGADLKAATAIALALT